MDLSFEKGKGKIAFYRNGRLIGETIPFTHDGAVAEDNVKEIENGVFQWVRTIRINECCSFQSIHVNMDLVVYYKPLFWMIPAVSYNGNKWGGGNEPKGFARDGAAWSFSGSRTSIPGATYSEGSDDSVALFCQPDSGSGISCSIIPGEDNSIHRIIWPEEERPMVYCERDRYSDGFKKEALQRPGDIVEIKAYIVVDRAMGCGINWKKFLDFAWKLNYHEVDAGVKPDKVWSLGIKYANAFLFVEDRLFRGYSKGLVWKEGQWVLRPTDKYLAGWTGQNLSLANSMLTDYLKYGNRSSLEKAIITLDTWVSGAVLPNGLLRCCFDYILGDKCDEAEVQDACNLGQAASGFFEASQLVEKCGFAKPEYRDTALRICEFVTRSQSENGQFAKSWFNDGSCCEKDGATGGFLIKPLVTAYRCTKEAGFLEAAEKGYAFYAAELMENKYTTAGALDTCCIDRESAFPLLESGLDLFETTANAYYLKCAEAAAYYLATWQWHHTIEFPRSSPLDLMKYDSFGGTAVSTQHHHLDPYAVIFVESWYRLAEYTGNELWKQRARAAWKNGSMGISGGTLEVMGKRRPEGSQDEGFLHTRWGVCDQTGVLRSCGYVTQWLVAWPTAFRLHTLRTFKKWGELE